jgi:hypothetical protein
MSDSGTSFGCTERALAQKSDGGAAEHQHQTPARDRAPAADAHEASLNHSPRSRSLMQLRTGLDGSLHVQKQLALQHALNGAPHDAPPVEKKPNATGLPDRLKAGVESLSGLALDDVRVHYNSSKPAAVQAHAYAQGSDIHVAPGQEKHLPHEAWHVVQQKQGRVKPTLQLKGVAINDDTGLEREADAMGARAGRASSAQQQASKPLGRMVKGKPEGPSGLPIQRLTIGDRRTKNNKELKKILGFDPAAGDPLRTEIVKRLLATDQSYSSKEHFSAEVDLRAHIVDSMKKLEKLREEKSVDYEPDDTMKMSDKWKGETAYEREEDVPLEPAKGRAHAFKTGRGTFNEDDRTEKLEATDYNVAKPSQAIKAIFAPGVNDNYAIECNTAMLLAHYNALRLTLGDDNFDKFFPDGLTLMREWLSLNAETPVEAKVESQELIPEVKIPSEESESTEETIAGLDKLIAGDAVYFANFADYDDRHPNGAYGGEWAIYTGGTKFMGFGVGELTFTEMSDMLRHEYNAKSNKPEHKNDPEKKEREEGVSVDGERTLDGKLPGITTVRRMATSERVKDALRQVPRRK